MAELPEKTNAAQISELVDQVISIDVTGYLSSPENQSQLIKYLHQEYSLPKYLTAPTLKILTPMTVFASKRASGWLGTIVTDRAMQLLLAIPSAKGIVDGISDILVKLDQPRGAEQQLKTLIKAALPASHGDPSALPLNLQAHFAELSKLSALGEGQAKIAALLEQMNNPQPNFRNFHHLGVLTTKTNFFFYGARDIPFVGRETEMTHLDDFLYSDASFSWQLIHASGGSGKSRLALELCLAVGGIWDAGFILLPDTAIDWASWQPLIPALLIFDYAAKDVDTVKVVLAKLSNRNDFEWPVRVILLERQDQGPWVDKLLSDQWIRASRYDEDLPLTPLNDTWPIFTHIFAEANKTPPNRETTLAKLEDIDSEMRPLFAALLADAMRNEEDTLRWDKKALIQNVIQRERTQIWQPAGVGPAEERLLALATLCGGLPVDEIPKEDFLPVWDMDTHPTLMQTMTGQVAVERVPPLEPDIIGEAFLAETLMNGNMQGQQQKAMVDFAWQNAPWAIFSFTDRYAQDFSDPSLIQILIKAPLDEVIQRLAWGHLAVNLIHHLAPQDIDAANAIYQDLVALSTAHDNEPALRLERAKAAVNLINHLAPQDIDAAKAIYQGLIALSTAHDNEPALRLERAKAAVNLINHLAPQDIDAASAIYQDLVALSTAHDNEPALRELRAQTAVNLIHDLAPQDIHAAKAIYQDLVALSTAHDNEPALRLERAKAAVNLINHLAPQDIDAANAIYLGLVALSTTHDTEPALRELRAKAAVRLILNLVDTELSWANALFAELEEVCSQNSDDVAFKSIIEILPAIRQLLDGAANR
jgi:hypothetical protein